LYRKGRRLISPRQPLPNFFIVGAAKAGTTSMYEYLEQHPDVYMAAIKEPHWFSKVRPKADREARPVTSEADYLKLFDGWRGERAVGEASPSYLWDREAPAMIERSVPQARIIIMLREPTSRAFSHYLMDVYAGRQKLPFYDALKEDFANPEKEWGVSHLYVELGLYCEQVSRYFERFGHKNVLVLFFEEIFCGPEATARALRKVLDFLGLDPGLNGICYQQRHNSLTKPRNRISRLILDSSGLKRTGGRLLPKKLKRRMREKLLLRRVEKPAARLDPQAAEFLREIYEPETACLEELLGRKLPWRPAPTRRS
jgi:hypothetical protein